ncbi:MAG: hypothetical protein Q8O24_07495, partial [Gallionellaceae bacterium]|nr:hypothetical protein [Gallionellaceae bacterium]
THPLRGIMKSQNDTLLRILTMLRHIPKHPQQITAKVLHERLEEALFKVSKRTVERDLLSLSDIFSLISNERSIPYGWSWSKDASPQFNEVKQLLVKTRNFENDLSDYETKVFGEGTFCYSDRLIEETRKALDGMPLTMDDHLHFKNNKGSFGKISIFDLMKNKMLIKDKITDADYHYASADELIAAGWVID